MGERGKGECGKMKDKVKGEGKKEGVSGGGRRVWGRKGVGGIL